MVLRTPLDLVFRDVFFELSDFVAPATVQIKLEGFHVTGSIKIKTAISLIQDLEERGLAHPGETTIVESSSGSLGLALSLVCKIRGYRFVCVTDPNVSKANLLGIRAYGGEVVMATERDANGGFLGRRIAKVKQLITNDPRCVWVNQYANSANKLAHYRETAEEILNAFPNVDWLFVGTGTTGTFMGCAERVRERSPRTKIVAVEPKGSVTFGGAPAGPRHIPGIGTSEKPELADSSLADEIMYVDEPSTIRTCRAMASRYGLLVGGSTGAVLAAVRCKHHRFRSEDIIVVVSPDLGDKYLESIYDDEWVKARYGDIFGEQATTPLQDPGDHSSLSQGAAAEQIGPELEQSAPAK